MDVDIQVSDETAPDYEIADNFVENLVDAIRSDMVGNEEQFVLINLGYATGLFENPKNYCAMKVEGSSGDGKSELKSNVDARWPNHWLFKTTQTSDKGLIDDDRWNDRYIAALDEMNKLPANTLEFLKSSYGDDADEDGMGFTYTRNVDDGDGGRTTNEIKKQAMPFIFLFADENAMNMDWELATRVMEVKVESDEEINEAVGAVMFDHSKVEVTEKDYEYNFNFSDGKDAIDNHIASIPRTVDGYNQSYARPVVIPYDEEKFGWDAWKIVKPIFDFKQADSKRAAKTVASLIKASALLNYHNRSVVEINDEEHYLAEAQDVANVLACRKTLLGMTHDLDEKKFAVIEALTDPHNGVGGPGPQGGLAAPIKDISEYIEDYADISSIGKSHLRSMLKDMDERFILTEHEEEGENGAHLYEYHGGNTFGHPNLGEYPDLWDDVNDPIREQPLRETVKEMKEELHAMSSDDLMSDDAALLGGTSDDTADDDSEAESDEEEGLSAFGGGNDVDTTEFDDVEAAVAERLQDVMDDKRVEPKYLQDGTDGYVAMSHMVGASPVEVYTNDSGLACIRADRPYKDGDKDDTILDPDDPLWENVSEGQVESRVQNAIAKLRSEDIFEIHDEPDSSEKYIVVHEIDQ